MIQNKNNKLKAYNAKEIVKKINSYEYSIEDLLSNNTVVQSDIKTKFAKMTSFFTSDVVINKLIYYSLNYSPIIEDFHHMSYNSCEILSQVKNPSLLDKLTLEEEYVSSEDEEEEEELEEYEDSYNEELSDNILEFTDFDTKNFDKEINYSPVKTNLNNKKQSKKMTIISFSEDESNHSSKANKYSYPFLDKIFQFVFNKFDNINNRKTSESLLFNTVNHNKTKILNKRNNKSNSNNSSNNVDSKILFDDDDKSSNEENLDNIDEEVKKNEVKVCTVKSMSNKENLTINKNFVNNQVISPENIINNNNVKIIKSKTSNISINNTLIHIENKIIKEKDNSFSNNSNNKTNNNNIINDNEYNEELLSGYFLRIFSNLINNRRQRVSICIYNKLFR